MTKTLTTKEIYAAARDCVNHCSQCDEPVGCVVQCIRREMDQHGWTEDDAREVMERALRTIRIMQGRDEALVP